MTANVKAMAFNVEREGLSWHRLEKGLPEIVDGDSVLGAMGKAKIDQVQVLSVPLEFSVDVPQADGTFKKRKVTTDKSALVMAGVPWTRNGIQSLDRLVKWYTPINNAEYAELLKPLEDYYQVVGVAQVGKLGEKFMTQFRMSTFDVGGIEQEQHKSYLTVAEDRKTGESWFMVSGVRVVCENTFNLSISDSQAIRNNKNIKLDLDFFVKLQVHAAQKQQQTVNDLNNLFTRKATKKDVEKVANLLFPMPKTPAYVTQLQGIDSTFDMNSDDPAVQHASKKLANKVRDHKAALARQEAYQKKYYTEYARFNDEFSYAAETKYAVFQAATSVYRATGNDDIFPRSEPSYLEMDNLFGVRQKAIEQVFGTLLDK